MLVRMRHGGVIEDVTPAGFSVRSRAHEYGGGAYLVDRGTVYFCNFVDQQLYCQHADGAPRSLTPPGYRFADAVSDTVRNRLIAVREDHTVAEREAVNTLVAIDVTTGGAGDVLADGHDFYSTPQLSPNGTQLCWLAWNHPDMPWTSTELWLAEFDARGALVNPRCIVGGAGHESIFQPQWSPDGLLYYVSDRSGWWNLYRWQEDAATAVCPMEAEFGLPQWVFGMSTYGFASADTIVCVYQQDGVSHLARIDLPSGQLLPFDLPATDIGSLRVDAQQAVFIAGSPTEPIAVVRLDLDTGRMQTVRRSSEVTVDRRYFSIPRAITFPTTAGLTAHAFYYPPRNPDFVAPAGEKPPLMVLSHGGPTGATSNVFDLGIQYWTSRGFAVLDVNYGGSTGYGRAYRQRLDGAWGVVDVDDCCNGARYLVEQGEVDGSRLIIRGGSAGGYTTLMALASRNVFHAGASYFGLSELEAFARDTHKFESRYLENLVGPYPARRELYLERSPLSHIDGFSCPAIFFQGLDDKVVPPNQAELMVDALRHKGIPVAYVTYAGEGHGFRQAKNLVHCHQAELYFYSRVFGFVLADQGGSVPIENLKE